MKRKCIGCGWKNTKDANFCRMCGKKLGETCKCWVLEKDNYDCGKDSCPGYKLFLEKIKK